MREYDQRDKHVTAGWNNKTTRSVRRPSSEASVNLCACSQPSRLPRMLRVSNAEKNSGSAGRWMLMHRAQLTRMVRSSLRLRTQTHGSANSTCFSVGGARSALSRSQLLFPCRASMTSGSRKFLERSSPLAHLSPTFKRFAPKYRALPSRSTSAGRHGSRHRMPSSVKRKALSMRSCPSCVRRRRVATLSRNFARRLQCVSEMRE